MERRRVPVRRAVVVAVAFASAVAVALGAYVYAPATLGSFQLSAARAAGGAARDNAQGARWLLDERAGGDAGAAMDCSVMPHTSVSGEVAFTWGVGDLGFKVADERECCDACRAHARVCGQPGSAGREFFTPSLGSGSARCHNEEANARRACNVFAYCPLERCFSFDIHRHERHECWLKYDVSPERPAAGTSGEYPAAMVAAPREKWPWAVAEDVWAEPMPKLNTWLSGALLPRGSPPAQAKAPHTIEAWCEREPGRC